jgi:uncharacterized phiE125 gp8 family phage protein
MQSDLLLKRVTDPAPLITLGEAKAHLRVLHDWEDEVISSYIGAATASLDGVSGEYGFPVTTQRWSLSARGVDASGRLYLPVVPAASLHSITYWPETGAQVTANLADWALYGNDERAFIEPVSGIWPELADRVDAFSVVWNAGYAVVPDDIKTVAKLVVGDLYANREGAASAVMTATDTIQRLVALRRRHWRAA